MFSLVKQSVAGLQILFVAFGAMVLVPLLTGLNPSMALLGAGVGTLLFQLCTRRQVPIFLGSSFAFIAPIIYATQTWGLPSTMFGLFAAGFMYFILGRPSSALVAWASCTSCCPRSHRSRHHGDRPVGGPGSLQYGHGPCRR